MKLFRVVTERDGATTKEPGRSTTQIERADFRYAADTIEEVWNAIERLRNDPECTVIALIEEAPAVTVLSQNGGSD